MSPRKTDETITVKRAIRELGIKPPTWYVACKRHAWLRDAITTRWSDDTDDFIKVIPVDVVERYRTERRQPGTSTPHAGAVKYAMYLTADELEQAKAALGELFGREVAIERAFKSRAKAEANGAEPEEDDDEEYEPELIPELEEDDA